MATLVIGMMAGCNEANVETKRTKVVLTYGAGPLEVVTIEGCEYFLCTNTYGDVIIHKGNCKNPIHPENKTY